ncbi:helix-turn-helix transcriptional regulator, partial [Dermatophilus congolensis]
PTRPTHRITQLIFEPSILTYPETLNTLQHSGNRHDAIRILDRIPITMLIADNDLALLDLSTYDDHTTNSLLIRNHRRILACHSLFDTFWSLALPAPSRGAPNLDPNTHRILALLASGATDTTIAEITGQSVRTIERRIHNLFTHLGATTRFQAGAQAARRGWI